MLTWVTLQGYCLLCTRPVRDGTHMASDNAVYHTSCFSCTTCGMHLVGQEYFCIAGIPYCKNDFEAKAFPHRCGQCGDRIKEKRVEVAQDEYFHPECFSCNVCKCDLLGERFARHEGRFFCAADYAIARAPTCCRCNEKVMPVDGKPAALQLAGRSYHKECFSCAECATVFEDGKAYLDGAEVYCRDHMSARLAAQRKQKE